ncbi:MAG: hypothetical protein ACO1TE_05405 [Prosthecobacter sp.]
MPLLTIDVPETLMPLLTSKAEACGETLEQFIVTYLSSTLEYLNDDVAVLIGIPELEKRDKGPIVENR